MGTAAVTVDTLRTTIPATTIPATTTSSRVDASVTTSRHSKINTGGLTVPVGRLIRPGEPGATLLEDTQAALMPDSLRGFQTIPGLTRPAPAPDNSLYKMYSSQF